MLNRFMINQYLIEIFKVKILSLCYLRKVVAQKGILDICYLRKTVAHYHSHTPEN